jgi:hypothetical protein
MVRTVQRNSNLCIGVIVVKFQVISKKAISLVHFYYVTDFMEQNIFEKLIVSQVVKNTPPFKESEDS